MRLVSYLDDGRPTYGAVVDDDRIVEIPTADPSFPPTLSQALRRQPAELQAAAEAGAAARRLDDVELLPVITDAAKIICVGINYLDHRAETGREAVAYPTLFTRFNDTHVGHGQGVAVPKVSKALDYEGELAVVIGEPAYEVGADEALGHVAGYACYDDLSVRDWQRHTSQFTPGKNFLGTGAFGPWLVTADEAPALADLHLETRVNGEVRQSAPITDMIFGIPALIEYISTFTPLDTGDVIVTGTPGGVGYFRDPPLLLAGGDVVEVEITGVGLLRTPIT